MVDFISELLERLEHRGAISGFEVMKSSNTIKYSITKYGDARTTFDIDLSVFKENSLTESDREKFKTLCHNYIWPVNDKVMKVTDLLTFIDSNYPDTSVREKQNRVLGFVRSLCKDDGAEISIPRTDVDYYDFWRLVYVRSESEFFFYLDSLIDEKYLTCKRKTNDSYIGISLTISGLNKIAEFEEKVASRTCFIAMWFDDSFKSIYNDAIEPALRQTGFEALRIDNDSAIPSDITINDAMLAAIKKSKFTIADFTQHRAGVYFEAGYALGRGQKVIYTCREDEIKNAHFDTRNYPHIVWKDAADLKQKLIDKIEVFIKG